MRKDLDMRSCPECHRIWTININQGTYVLHKLVAKPYQRASLDYDDVKLGPNNIDLSVAVIIDTSMHYYVIVKMQHKLYISLTCTVHSHCYAECTILYEVRVLCPPSGTNISVTFL